MIGASASLKKLTTACLLHLTMSRPSGRPRAYEMSSPGRRGDGFGRTPSAGSRRDYERDLDDRDRRDYERPYDRHDSRGYYPSDLKRHLPVYDRRMDDIQNIKRPPSRDRVIDRAFPTEDEEIAFLAREERRACPPITLQVAPPPVADEYWD